MVTVSRFFVIFVAIGFMDFCFSEEGVRLHLKANRCNKFNRKYLSGVTCRVRAFNRTVQLMSYEMKYHPNITLTDLRIEITSYIKFGAAYRPSLVKFTEDWCAAMNGSASHYMRLMLKSFSKYGNVVRPCPITGISYVKNMIVDTSNFPQFVPIGDYRMDYNFFTLMNGRKEFVYLLQDYWDISPLGAIQF